MVLLNFNLMFTGHQIGYEETNAFSKVVLDYLKGKEELNAFYSLPATIEGLKQALCVKENHEVNRDVLVNVLVEQYKSVKEIAAKVETNVRLLRDAKTFTICTAHQPNLFTGPLYFIYKILHVIKIADRLKTELPEYNFVPVFYMGCEDADLEELNHFTVKGKKYVWNTKQSGAVGRMKVDTALVKLIDELEQQLVYEHGSEWTELLRKSFTIGKDIQTATFEMVHDLFADYGLVILIPDNADLKQVMIPVFKEELLKGSSFNIVSKTSDRLSQHYNVQAHAREINLFYLIDDKRERIEKHGDHYKVLHTEYTFNEEEILKELEAHPERFSPNVILRGLFQETILPNLAFIGGGGELAYWLQFKDLFNYYHVPYPVIVLRNSFLVIEQQQDLLMSKVKLDDVDLFKTEQDLLNKLVEREGRKPVLNGELDNLKEIYSQLKSLASTYDPTLGVHVDALKTKTLNHLITLEKKMLRAERRKHESSRRQVAKLKEQLFPNNGLQERVENVAGYYDKWGKDFIKALYDNSLTVESEFVILHQTS
jgi:bacillithiol biosynthesis cysteine-adding enzyme BshC